MLSNYLGVRPLMNEGDIVVFDGPQLTDSEKKAYRVLKAKHEAKLAVRRAKYRAKKLAGLKGKSDE